MKMESGDFVMPGDFLSVSEQFLPGQGAYEDDGSVKSGVPGNVLIDEDEKEISVISKSGGPNLLKVGSQVTPGYIDKLTDAFRIGDLIEAKVVKIMGDNLDLNTEDITSGVVKAMCTRCRTFMDPCNESEVYCPVCDRKEKRKVSKNYDY